MLKRDDGTSRNRCVNCALAARHFVFDDVDDVTFEVFDDDGEVLINHLLNVCIYGWGLVGLLAGASLTPGVGVYQIMKV